MTSRDPTTAERSRLYRLRQRAGVGVVRAEVDRSLMEMMLDAGAISEEAAMDRDEVGRALVDLAHQRVLDLIKQPKPKKETATRDDGWAAGCVKDTLKAEAA